MKNWKTTTSSILVALTALAFAKRWIDEDTALCIGAIGVALFGVAAKDAKKE